VRVRVDGVAPVLSDATLTGAVEAPAAGARVVDAHVARRVVPRTRGEETPRSEIERLERERDRLRREIGGIEARVTRLEGRSTSLGGLLDLTLTEVGEDAAWGRHEAARWTDRLESLRGQVREVEERRVTERHRLQERLSEHERLEGRLAALENPSREEWAGLEAEIVADEAGRYELRFEYVVPGACWRPWHTARLVDGPRPVVAFRVDGCVWQNTGEDWENVRLLFSTQRPSLGTEPPKLTSDVLRVQKKPEEVVVETREQEITTTGLGAETTAADRLPGIDDGGEAVSLEANTPSSVPSDGRACRVPLLRFETEAEVSLVAVPESVPAVLTKSVQPNEAGAPLLAGPVDLIRGGGFAGRTSLLYVAPGERFALGWGPEPDLRLQRDTEIHRDKQKMMSSWETRQHRATVRISNIGPEARTVKVTERIPVSEIDKVVVVPDEKETTDGARPDKNGFVEWTVRLPAHQHEALTLKYTLKKHQDVEGI
jgi:uncharacterized protein (TIGR02231 family)